MKIRYDLSHAQGSVIVELMVNPRFLKMDAASAKASGESGLMPFAIISAFNSEIAASRPERMPDGNEDKEEGLTGVSGNPNT